MKQRWSTVNAGDIVKGKDGYSWNVTNREGDEFTLEREGRPPFTGRPTGEVEVLSSDRIDYEMALATTQVVLGGVVSARKKGEIWYVPANFPEPGSLLAHGHLFHGTIGDGEASLSSLITWHDELHRAKGVKYEPHHHDPDFWRM